MADVLGVAIPWIISILTAKADEDITAITADTQHGLVTELSINIIKNKLKRAFVNSNKGSFF